MDERGQDRRSPAYPRRMRWINHGERPVYESPWLSLGLADIEIPGHRRFEHEVIRFPTGAAGAVVHDPDLGVLLIWRHRFPTDSWGWEIPAGRIDPGEDAATCAAREAEEETGWRPGPVSPLVTYAPSTGISDQRFHVFEAAGAAHVGDPTDPTEAALVEWRSFDQVRTGLRDGSIIDGMSVTGLAYFLALSPSATA
jgi:8-oxo-dGTP pyrophosphatase MutT (NUDIX family)